MTTTRGDRWREDAASNETPERIDGGRVLEARGELPNGGGRVFRVRIIAPGDSRNGRRYTESVLRSAARLYEGAKAYDHHRTVEEMSASTIAGMVGYYRNVEASSSGIDADLVLLPGASHTAEALDATLAAQAAGLPPLVGISHDVLADWRPVREGSRSIQEATAIRRVLSADVVADPAAGGRAIRMVAGGIEIGHDESPQEGDSMNLKQLMALLRAADPARVAELLREHAAILTAAGLEPEDIGYKADGSPLAPPAPAEPPAPPAASAEPPAAPAPAPAPEPELVGAAVESYVRGSFLARQLVRGMLAEAQLPELEQVVTNQLPERFTEADVSRIVDVARRATEAVERNGLGPRVPAQVTVDALDKVRQRLDATLRRNWREGFTSFFEMFEAVTGRRLDPWNPDSARQIVRESWAASGWIGTGRAAESVSSTTWAEILGDSITRRLIELYQGNNYQGWRALVRTVPVRDFRTQRRVRMGGYGVLPDVLQGGTYQPLTSPTDEEATYAVAKKGGTEDLTFEAITNDDLEAVARIPEALARAAAMTLYRFVFLTLFSDNPTCTYDSTALFHASHGNTTAVALSQSGASQLRQKMRDQAGYGVSTDVLGVTPSYLVVPNELEELGAQIALGDRAVPSSGNASDLRNIHQGLSLIVCDHLTDANDWFMAASPTDLAGIEVGFLGGREEPELLMQDDPRVGAAFSSDKVTWKIRHIYSGAVIDHRAFQRGTQ